MIRGPVNICLRNDSELEGLHGVILILLNKDKGRNKDNANAARSSLNCVASLLVAQIQKFKTPGRDVVNSRKWIRGFLVITSQSANDIIGR